MNETSQQQLPISVSWDEQSGVPVPINQFALVQGPGNGGNNPPIYEFHLGHVSSPLINESDNLHDPDFANKLKMTIIRVGHFQIAIDTLRQLHEGLGQLIQGHDAQDRS